MARTVQRNKLVELIMSLRDRITGQVPEVTRSLDSVGDATERAQNRIEASNQRSALSFDGLVAAVGRVRLAALAFVAVVARLGASVREWVRLANIQETAETRLETSLRNLTGASEEQIQALKDQASALQDVTGFGDETTISAQAMLATFQLSAEQIAQLTPLLLDTAEGLRRAGQENVNLEQVAIAVGKAFTTGVGALSRYGVVLTDVQREAFKTADQQGRLDIIVQALEQNFGGLAEAVGQTFEGAARRAQAASGDLGETLGSLFTESEQVAKLLETVTQQWERFSEAVSSGGPVLQRLIGGIAGALNIFLNSVRVLFNSFTLVFRGIGIAIVETVEVILTALSRVTFGGLSQQFKDAAEQIRQFSAGLREGLVQDTDDIAEAYQRVGNVFEETSQQTSRSLDVIERDVSRLDASARQSAEVTELQVKALEAELRRYERAYARHVGKVEDLVKEQADLSKEFDDLVEDIRDEVEDEPIEIFDVARARNEAARLFELGEFDDAIAEVRKGIDAIRDMAERGAEADIVLQGLALQLRVVGERITAAQTEEELINAEATADKIDELKDQITEAGKMEIQLSEASVEAARLQIENALTQVVRVPVEPFLVGEAANVAGFPLPGSQSGVDVVGPESDKGGRRV